MHSHCAMWNEQEWEKEAKHQCVTMQTLTALIRMSPWTTCMLWLETAEGILRRGSRVQTWANHPILSATPADSPDSSWGSLSCCCTHLSVFLISQSGKRRALVRHPTALPTSPVLPMVNMESSVKGWPLRPLHLRIVLGHYFNPTPLTFRWLICDFWWMTFPSAL